MRKWCVGVLLAVSLLAVAWLLAACGSSTPLPATATSTVLPPTPVSPSPEPTVDLFASQGGAEPRSAGYWLLWNSCTEGNQAATAKANGGREAAWLLLDDLLQDPGILIGELAVETCEQGIALLRAQDLTGGERASDAAYPLATQLLVAQLNLAVGADYCPAVDKAVQAGQLLLLSLAFDGTGSYLATERPTEDYDVVVSLTDQLGQYNNGGLCR